MSDSQTAESTRAPGADQVGIDELPLPYFELDASGAVRRINQSALEMTGAERHQVVGTQMWNNVAADQLAISQESFLQGLSSGNFLEPVRRTIYVVNSGYRTFDLYRSPIRDQSGKVTGIRHLGVELCDAVSAHQEASHTLALLESTLAALPCAVIVTDPLGFIRYANAAAEALTRWDRDDLAGENLDCRLALLNYASEDGGQHDHDIRLQQPCKGEATVLDRRRCRMRVRIATCPMTDVRTGYVSGVVWSLRSAEEEG